MTILFKKRSLHVLMLLSALSLYSCSKDVAPPEPPAPPVVTVPAPQGTIQLHNYAPTAVRVVVNGTATEKLLASGATLDMTGAPGQPVYFSFEAAAVDVSGAVVGLTITMNDQLNYPEDKTTVSKEINIPSDYFFLKVTNTQTIPTDQVVVNYQMSDEAVTEISGMPFKTTQYGYYLADKATGKTNIKVIRSKEFYNEWNFSDEKIPGEENQVIALKVY